LIYFSVGDIFSELGGLTTSFRVIFIMAGTFFFVRFIFEFAAMVKRKSSHRFRLVTIEKYKKCFPQMLEIIDE